MRNRTRLARCLVALCALGVIAACRAQPSPERLTLVESRSAERVPRHELLELTFRHDGLYRNNFLDVHLEAVFRSPDGTTHPIRGFYYGGHEWKVRFRPEAVGNWTYTYTFIGKQGFSRSGAGAFETLGSPERGPVRRIADRRFRWAFADGTPFFPVGIQDCVLLRDGKLATQNIDGGPTRNDPSRQVSWEEYFAIYGGSGFNLLRFSQKNCSFPLADLDRYRVVESLATDEFLATARRHGFRVMFGFFGAHGQFAGENRMLRVLKRWTLPLVGIHSEAVEHPDDRATLDSEKRFVEYCIARWGVYADFWELLNERHAVDAWTTLMATHVRASDPDHKAIATSWEKPMLPAIDINAPHWYSAEDELVSDLRLHEQAVKWKQPGKPVIVGEHGNDGMNWSPRSAVRMRIRLWTSLFDEISLVFWNTSWSKLGINQGVYTLGTAANIYLGPEERGYVRVLQDFSARLDAGIRITSVSVTSPSLVRAYGLASENAAAVYLQHAASHSADLSGASIGIDLSGMASRGLVGEWIDPANGATVGRIELTPGIATLSVPPFKVDLALIIQPAG